MQLACQAAAAANQVWQTGTGMSGTLPVSVVCLYLGVGPPSIKNACETENQKAPKSAFE